MSFAAIISPVTGSGGLTVVMRSTAVEVGGPQDET